KIILKDTDISGIGKEIQFAVWSDEGGQDDLKWYTAAKDEVGNYSYTVKISDHRTAGQYQVHCYMVKNDGNMVMLTS
ncbi:GBS Bsp-like repeat-containing protein, partial [[Clostridium] spiroforme]|nr:GBS Bsp-like repeat-containing protein [Thomasclavelia spiroformis]